MEEFEKFQRGKTVFIKILLNCLKLLMLEITIEKISNTIAHYSRPQSFLLF